MAAQIASTIITLANEDGLEWKKVQIWKTDGAEMRRPFGRTEGAASPHDRVDDKRERKSEGRRASKERSGE